MQKFLLALLVLLAPSTFVFAGPGSDDIPLEGFIFHGQALPKLRTKLAPTRQGTVWNVEVVEGAQVRKGDLLLEFDTRVQQAAVNVARASAESTGELRRAQVALRVAEASLARLQASHEKDARSVTQASMVDALGAVEESRATLLSAQESASSSRATLGLELARLEELRLRAPFDGVITRIHSRVGESVPPGQPALELVDLSTLVAEIHVPATRFGELVVGGRLDLEASVPVSKVIAGTITWIDPVIDGGTRCFRCVIEIDNADKKLPAGFTVLPVLD